MARAKSGSGFLLMKEPPPKRYVLTCRRCGMVFENETATLGEVQRAHFMRMHDTAKIAFELLDRWKNTRRVVN